MLLVLNVMLRLWGGSPVTGAIPSSRTSRSATSSTSSRERSDVRHSGSATVCPGGQARQQRPRKLGATDPAEAATYVEREALTTEGAADDAHM